MHRLTTVFVLAALTPLAATSAAAQDHEDHARADHGEEAPSQALPDGWLMRLDRSAAGAEMVDFQVMEPGWHVKTGRAGSGIFWIPAMTASGDFTARTTYHLFSPASHAESFGLFIGGRDLEGEEQEYLYFLVRQTGEYLIKRRAGDDTANLVGWTAHDAVPEAPAGELGPTRYDLTVAIEGDEVAFRVNGATVHTLPAAGLRTDGVVGLRINHMLDLHVEAFTVEEGM